MTGSHEPTTPPPVPPPPPVSPPGREVTGLPAEGAGTAPPGWSTGPTGPGPQGGGQAAGTPRPDTEVPDLDDRDRALDRRVITVWRFSTATTMLVPTAVLTAVAFGFLGSPVGWVVPAVLVLLTAVLTAWYPGARYERWRWRLTDLAVELERGVVVRQAEALPYFRIQQIDVTQGPIDRMLGLASLQVTSASASGSVTLPGIAADAAPGIRRALLARAASAVRGHDAGVRDAV